MAEGQLMTGIDWKEVHGALRRLGRQRAQHDYEEATWLVLGLEVGVHRHLGFGSYLEYLERVLGYPARIAAERLRVAVALKGLPQIAESLRDGTLSWSAVRELCRVATSQTEGEWLQAAVGKSVREVESLVSGHAKGDLPTDPTDPTARRHVLRFEVTGETLALFRDLQGKLQAKAGRHLDDDELLQCIAREILGGPKDEGRSSYQIAMTVCDRCRQGWQEGGGKSVPVGPAVIEMAMCDAQVLPATHVGEKAANPAGEERQVEAGRRSHVGRARQTTSPAVKRAAKRRDGSRCAVPGCPNSAFVEIHHIVPRSEGGRDELSNVVTLCGAHHRAVHEGALHVHTNDRGGFEFLHADGSPYGRVADADEAMARRDAFLALCSLGWKQGQAKAALALVPRDPSATTESLVRRALAILVPPRGKAPDQPAKSGSSSPDS